MSRSLAWPELPGDRECGREPPRMGFGEGAPLGPRVAPNSRKGEGPSLEGVVERGGSGMVRATNSGPVSQCGLFGLVALGFLS